MSSSRLESNTKAVYAQSPRLFGVPVPQRAFGLGAGWRRESIVGDIVLPAFVGIDERFECSVIDPSTVMAHDSWRSAKNVASLSERQAMASTQPKTPAVHTAKQNMQNLTIEPEVAAA